MKVEGGAARPIHITTNAPTAGPATPVYLYTQATLGDRKIESGITSVYSVSDAELADGTFKLQGNVAAIPVIDYTSQDVSAPDIHPMPVYILNPSTPTPPVVNQWWLSGGVDPANCVAAYQAKGVANYTASKINLVNSMTHVLTDAGHIPAWNINTGWSFNGIAGETYLETDIKPADINRGDASIIVRYANMANDRGLSEVNSLFGSESYFGQFGCDYNYIGILLINTTGTEKITFDQADDWGDCSGEAVSINHIWFPSGIVAIAGRHFYHDGVEVALESNLWTRVMPNDPVIAIGADNYKYNVSDLVAVNPTKGDIYAIAFYDAPLTAAQVAAITTAMSAL